ncbi:MAG: citrate lyase acyl carrier protein [Clostridia bacterium]|jgi:citrate lyase subunit gamma (acyl carrier protein)|nr:citrate lyase acyl carrier protein [Clostridia bacterium]MBQ4587476.1 citrate lyase acyl carrier protein [Clostridia bacterium]MBQ6883064.1 citrate lyase acyl carrier protein [Clostridia bacterium]MBR2933862.1 citrate lyase acyl carrier protein [Clostridia bacterium]MBR6687197.1 citrate lyase acyl carrier protein [Clostridia bacterium]
MKRGTAGTLESNDAMIMVKESDGLKITITSIVYDFFHEQIENVIRETLKEEGLTNVEVICNDKGALDYTIKARLLTAISRMEEEK